jgi:hypothetical protein
VTGPQDPHLDLDTLAELDEGLVPADRVDAVTTHLTSCPACRERHAALRTTRALLTTLPPEPMPPDVGARLDTALGNAALGGSTVVPMERGRRRWIHHPSLPGLAAMFAAAALISAVVIGVVRSGSNDHRATTSAGGGSAAGSVAANYPVTDTGRDYTKGTVASLVPQLLQSASATATPGGAAGLRPSPTATTIPTQLARLFGSRAALRACVDALTAGGPPQSPLAVDFGSYNGQPAVVVVLPGLVSTNVDAWIVGPACGTGSENLLLYESIPRPSG